MGVIAKERPEGSGVWWIFISHNGKRKAKKIGGRKAAEKAAEQLAAKIALGDLGLFKDKKEIPTFKEYSQKYLAFIKTNRRESTFERYDGVLAQHILPVFKNRELDTITRGQIRDFLISKSEKMDVGVLKDVLSGVLSFAMDDEIISSNPVIGITKKLEIKKDKDHAVDPFKEAEIALFLEACKEISPELFPLFLTACRAGLRLGEILALQWGDCQFNSPFDLPDGTQENRPFIWVRRSYRRGKFTRPKNGKDRRVDMSMQLKDALSDHLTAAKKKALKSGSEIPALVFNRNGEVIEQNYIRRIYERILNKAGLRHIKFHGLRHSFASILLSKGESPVYVKEQMGHSSINITVDIYGKWIPTTNLVGVNRLDSTQPDATQTQPKKTEKAQPAEIAPKKAYMVPKTRLELVQASAH